MGRTRARRLSIPAALTVTALSGPVACGDDGGTTDATAATTATTQTTGTTSASESSTSPTGPSTTSTETTGGMIPDCGSAQSEEPCAMLAGCRWIFNLGCVLECDVIPNENTCNMQIDCEWTPDEGCHTPDSSEVDS